MSTALQSAYSRLIDRYSYPYQETILQFPAQDVPPRELIIEIGFGMGDATYKTALENPEKDYIGIEVYKPGIGKLLDHIDREGIENLKVIEHDAVEVLGQMIQNYSVNGFHIFFPDPWPKKKHHKRRIIQDEFVSLLIDKLVPGGYIYAVTDWEDYAEQMLQVFGNQKLLLSEYENYAEPQKWRPFTKFERKGKEKSHSIFELLYKKR
ncbi:tRNA (guanosine(46)-N7)-methyltransferase TrmB [Oceanispirochaeta sp.]|uniref:tRNA (guanosine(46)-N7)-methyltransferase TrmB n=1 Tax=Oceanispirochaeta sp. TaxID=2035350 RepID=UPI002619378D|nr:tRNA (guanosine(46)-N7)-methyltransferase TrmB [Oceanispirochaeta sp.]MDA3956960.1 tRNA (guanosine(46)-N7)-methyltransferase TrmB [Oceanispirochaeta sp.]